MKKRLTKVLALGLTAVMIIGTPLSAVAAEITPTDVSVTSEATEDAQAVTDETAEKTTACENSDNTEQTDDAADVAEVQEAQPEENTAAAKNEADPDADSEENFADVQNEAQPEIAAQTADDGIAVMALSNGYNPMDLNGLVQLNDGNWYYMENGEVSDNADGTVKPAGGSWWYVRNYKIDFSYNGFGTNGDQKWYVESGQVQFGYTGIASGYNKYGTKETYYVTNGRVDKDFTGICYGTIDGVDGWYNFREGCLGYGWDVVEYNGAWWYVGDNSRIDFSYTGIGYNEAGSWYIRNGQVDFSYTGMIEGWHTDDFRCPYQYYFVNGKLNEGLNGVFYTTVNGVLGWYGYSQGALATAWEFGDGEDYGTVLSNDSGWWYIDPRTGMVDFSYTGLARNEFPGDDWYHYWYVENGQINFNYNGFVTYTSRYNEPAVCYITGGQADANVNGVYQLNVNGKTDWYGFWRGMTDYNEVQMNPNDGSWWYVGNDGVIDFSYTGIAYRHDQEGYSLDSWYVKNGRVDFSYNGWYKYVSDSYSSSYTYYYVENGRVRSDISGLIQTTIDGKNAWWNIEDGKIYTTEYEYAYQNHKLVYYNGDWWAVSNSQVDFGYTGFVYYDDVCWYVENGRVNFTKTGFVDFDGYGAYEYIQNGQHDSDFNGLVYAELGGKTSWWQVQHGRCYHYDGTWYYEPGNYAANASGLWAIINGEAAFNVNGVYTVSRGYDMDMGVPSTTINYTYEVVNGLVTDMQVVVQQ